MRRKREDKDVDAIEAILVKAAEEIFNDMRSDSTMSRLRMLYSGALAAAAPDEINDAVSDIVRYESDNKLSTQMILDSYDAPPAQRTLSDFSAAAMYFARDRAESGKKHILTKLMQKDFLGFVNVHKKEIESINGFKTVSETLLDLNYAAGDSDNLSIRMRNILV